MCAGGTSLADAPRVYAITGATAVPSPGARIDDATLVIRDGLIEAIGRGVDVPPDAIEIDGAGLWVYAGLIDARSELGLPAAPIGGERRGAGAGDAEPRQGAVHPLGRIHAESRVRDSLVPFSGSRKREMERLRELGFTAVLVTPRDGILRGTSTAILLSEDRPVPELILRDPVAQHAAFERGSFGEGYPTSLMGAAAALRQTLLDTQRYGIWSARYERDPVGMSRPEVHATFEALRPTLDGSEALFIETDDPLDSLLAHRIAAEFELNAVLLASGHEWEIADQIAATGRTLVLPVAFPDKPAVDEDNDALNRTRRELRRYLTAPEAPALLDRAGVRFALTRHGLANTANFSKNLIKMIDRGLPPDIALSALTTVPAELLGLDRVLGTLEPGKIANVVVADGPLFEDGTKIRRVFVDGIDHEVKVKEKPKGDPNAVVDPRGEWSIVFDFGSRTGQRSWTIEGEPGAYTGSAETRGGTVPITELTLEGNVMTVIYSDTPVEIVVIVKGDTLEGTAEAGSHTASVTGIRVSGPDGKR